MGCGMAVAKNGWQLLVARYAPAGNIKGGYEDNVGDLLPEIYSGTVSQWKSLFFKIFLQRVCRKPVILACTCPVADIAKEIRTIINLCNV